MSIETAPGHSRPDSVVAETRPRRPDLATRKDVEVVLRAFYLRAFDDDLLRRVFLDVARMDLEQHLPVIGDFWEKVLFRTADYRGNARVVHLDLHAREPLTPAHFERWLSLWNDTIDRHYAGPVARTAKQRAARIAAAMQHHLHRDGVPAPGGHEHPEGTAGGRSPAHDLPAKA